MLEVAGWPQPHTHTHATNVNSIPSELNRTRARSNPQIAASHQVPEALIGHVCVQLRLPPHPKMHHCTLASSCLLRSAECWVCSAPTPFSCSLVCLVHHLLLRREIRSMLGTGAPAGQETVPEIVVTSYVNHTLGGTIGVVCRA